MTLELMAACVSFSALYEYVSPSHEGGLAASHSIHGRKRILSTSIQMPVPCSPDVLEKNSLTVAVCKTDYLKRYTVEYA